MTCLENFPNDLEPTLACATDVVEFGPIAAILTIIIGVPLVRIILGYLKR